MSEPLLELEVSEEDVTPVQRSPSNEGETSVRAPRPAARNAHGVPKRRPKGTHLNGISDKENKKPRAKKRKSSDPAENAGDRREASRARHQARQPQPRLVITQPAHAVNWMTAFEPRTADALLVNPNKVKEIRNWLRRLDDSPEQNILLLTGPSGSCKLSSIRILGEEDEYDICEFESATNEVNSDVLTDENNTRIEYESQAEKFSNFLLTASCYKSLLRSNKERLIVVKDIPHTFVQKGGNKEFFTILRKFKRRKSFTPLVFILTSTTSKALNFEHTLFPENIRSDLGIQVIKMNAIAATVVKKALKLICAKMSNADHFIQPSQDVIDNITVQSQGDIRSAIYSLQMACQTLPGTLTVSVGGDEVRKLGGKKSAKGKLREGVGRDEQLSIFHGLGRLMYPKMELNPQTNRMELTHNPEEIAEKFSDQPKNFIELFYSNYLKNFTTIEGVCAMSELLSISNVFQNEYRQADQLHKLDLCMVARGAMVHNLSTRKGFRPITGYASKKFENMEQTNFQQYLNQRADYNGGHRVSKNDFFADFHHFTSIIKPVQQISKR